MHIAATHKKSGRTGHVLAVMRSSDGAVEFYWFEQDFYRDGTASGWHLPDELNIPEVNA